VVAVAGVLLVVLAGCTVSPTDLGDEVASGAVRSLVDDRVSPSSYVPDIQELAERAEAATAEGSIRLVGVEAGDPLAHGAGEEIGWLTFGLTVSDTREPEGYGGSPREQDPGPYCYRVAFDHWDVTGMRGTPCPDPLVAVPAPPSERPEVAENAEEAVWSVLESLPAELPSEDDIVAQVTALLDPHENGVTPLAEVTVHVEGGDVAVATGDRDRCVLVGRLGGEVQNVSVPSVYLQPGEAGCTAGTAFADLRPPH
jgi:hypothetical protein